MAPDTLKTESAIKQETKEQVEDETKVDANEDKTKMSTHEDDERLNVYNDDAKMSTLEVDPKMYHLDLEVDNRKHFYDPEVVKLDYSTLEVLPGSGMLEGMRGGNLQAYHPEVAGNDAANGPIPYRPGTRESDMKIPIDEEDVLEVEPPRKRRTICGISPKTFWLLIAALVLLAIGGAVGGAVGATQANKSNSTSSNQGAGGTNGDTPDSTTNVYNAIRPDSQLAALAQTVDGSVQYRYRVYYQDTNNSLKETTYISDSSKWNVQTILDGSNVMPGTYIAASAPKFTRAESDKGDISVYFYDTDAKLSVISTNAGLWSPSQERSSIPSIKEASYGKITAYYNECELCSNTTMVAVASNGNVTFYNHTASNAWEDEKGLLLADSAHGNSSVFLAPFRLPSSADQVTVLYQRASDGHLVDVRWIPLEVQIKNNQNLSETGGWVANAGNSDIGSMPPNASFAMLGWGDVNGSPAYEQAVTTGFDGTSMQVFQWTPNAWASTPEQPDALRNVTSGTAIAAHSYQRVYAMNSGVLKQYAVTNSGEWQVNLNVPVS